MIANFGAVCHAIGMQEGLSILLSAPTHTQHSLHTSVSTSGENNSFDRLDQFTCFYHSRKEYLL